MEKNFELRPLDVVLMKNEDYILFHFVEVFDVSGSTFRVFPSKEKFSSDDVFAIYRRKGNGLQLVWQEEDTITKTEQVNRNNLLRVCDVISFGQWLSKSGWEIEKNKSENEVLRVTKRHELPIILYLGHSKKAIKEHTFNGELYVTVMGKDVDIVNEFLKETSDLPF